MDINTILKLSGAWRTFTANHPRFPEFLKAVKSRGISEGMTIDIAVNYPDGTSLKSGIKVRQSDVDLLAGLSSLAEQGK